MLYKKGKNYPMTQAVDTFASYNLTILFIWFKFDNRLILPVHKGLDFIQTYSIALLWMRIKESDNVNWSCDLK